MNQRHQHQSAGCLKGIVHPKMKILSSFAHPVVPNLYECLCSAEYKGRYSEECGKQSSSGAPLTSIVFFFLLWKSMVPKTAWLQPFFKISSFVFGRTKKFIQVWNYLKVSKWWQNFHFWVNYPFNHTSLYFNINWIGPRMILKEYSAVAVVTKLWASDWQINCTLLYQCCFLFCGYFS